MCVCDTEYNDKKAVERSGDRLNEIDARSADRWASRQKVGVVTSAGAFNYFSDWTVNADGLATHSVSNPRTRGHVLSARIVLRR